MSNIHFKIRRKRSLEDEAQIRREFYSGKTKEEICAKWKISEPKLRAIIGGPLTKRYRGIEAYYGG